MRYCKQPCITDSAEERYDTRIVQTEILVVRMYLYPLETCIRNLLEIGGIVPVGRMDRAELYKPLRRLLPEHTVTHGLRSIKNHLKLGWLGRNRTHDSSGHSGLVKIGELRCESAIPHGEQTASQLLDHHIHGARSKLVRKIMGMEIYYPAVHEIISRYSPNTR